jgi:O-acetylhomoserine/O-acetylserine sulfhydrylase-like pyridoxal-dependent enzyme
VVAAVRSMHNVLGGTIDPHAAYLLLRGMKTLDVRVQRQNSVRYPSGRPIYHCKASMMSNMT